MCRIILGILIVVMAIDSTRAWYSDRAYRDEYTAKKEFIRVLANLTQVPSDIPNEAREVNLRFNMITNIPVNAFSRLRYCKVLRLSHNEISVIDPEMFNGLNSLKHLYLENNMISAIQIVRGTFMLLNQLKSLNVGLNQLTVIESYTFSGVVSLKRLYLHQNNINDIKDFAFLTLGKLTHLYLHDNQLVNLSLNTFAGLGSLNFLDLGDNGLTTLDRLVLSPFPRPLRLALDAQQRSMVCDIKLCWLKLEEEAGSIALNFSTVDFSYARNTGVYYPNCTGDVDWLLFECPVPCGDPGQLDFAERSESFLPVNGNSQPELDLLYSTDSELTYTCDLCYTGGGNITCQSNGQWTSKPNCTRSDNNVACSAPALANGYLTPSSDQYECGVRVTYACDEGYTLSGPSDGACGPDGQFVGQIPSCVKNDA